jgi:nucleotide-binding universal stress UspA family protein
MAHTVVNCAGGVVVGHDGSEAAGLAVRHAGSLARRLGCTLHVVRAWTLITAPRPATMTGGYVPPPEDFENAVLEELAAHVAALKLPEDTDIQLHATRGQSTERLLEAAEGAEMLVVGKRGGGGFAGLKFGSTADQVVRYAKVPVLVVPNRHD